jgi:integrase
MTKFRNGLSKVGKVYHYCFRIHGEQFKGSTRAIDRDSAEKVLAQKRKEALFGPPEPKVVIPVMKDLITNWLDTHRPTHSVQHLKSVEHLTRNWITPALGNIRINRINTQAVLNLRRRLLEGGKSPATANLVLRVLKLLLNFAIRLDLIEKFPFRVQQIKLQKPPRPTIPPDRMREFLAAVDKCATNPQAATLIRLMVGLGLRESEALEARWKWLDLSNHNYTVGRSKTRTPRTIPVPAWLWSHILDMPKTLSEFICPCSDGTAHRGQFTKKTLARAAKDLGIEGITPHSLRRTFATLHAQEGTALSDLQGMMGHSSPILTLLYIQQSSEAKRRAQDALSQRLGLA